MSYRRSLARLVALSMGAAWLLAACAAAQNTPAQVLALERWYACDHFATIRLDRVQLDGQILAMGTEYEVAPFTACVQQMATDQARHGAAVGPDSATVVSVEGHGKR
jgi:hypothetical protein